jgi:hypothetical protein
MRRAIWTARFARAHLARRSSLRSAASSLRSRGGGLFAQALIAFVLT